MGRDLHLPPDGAVRAAAVVLHPHPAMGGDRHHPLVVAVADGLVAEGVAALRIDLSDPDVAASAAALESVAGDLLDEVGVDRVVLIGYSWGAAVSALANPGSLAARVRVAPPVSIIDVAPPGGEPTLVLVPAHDQYGPPDEVRRAVEGWPSTTMEVVEGIDHFLAGGIQRIAGRTVAWVTEEL